MKKILSVLLAALMLAAVFAGCGSKSKGPEGTLEEILDKIYQQKDTGLSLFTTSVDLADADAVKSYTGLDDASQITEAIASEPLIGSQAYSLVLVRVADGADAAKVAEAMITGVNTAKWICVSADDVSASACGDVAMLVMVDVAFADTMTSSNLTDAFKTVCGGKVDVEIVQ